MSNTAASFARASSVKALLCFFIKPETYLDMAVSHEMAIHLEASDLRRSFDDGKFPSAGWEFDARLSAATHARELRRGMCSALTTTIAFAAVGLALAAILGKVHPALPLDWGKLLGVVGGLLAAWGTLFELGGYTDTFKGESLHEQLRPIFFRAVFLPGLILATLGQFWWQ
jgi:hypothetical protein